MNEKEILEGYLNQMEGAYSELSDAKNGLLSIVLSPFEPIFESTVSGSLLVETMQLNELLEIKNSFEEDILPMFEESKYEEGIEKIKGWQGLLDKCLEEQK